MGGSETSCYCGRDGAGDKNADRTLVHPRGHLTGPRNIRTTIYTKPFRNATRSFTLNLRYSTKETNT